MKSESWTSIGFALRAVTRQAHLHLFVLHAVLLTHESRFRLGPTQLGSLGVIRGDLGLTNLLDFLEALILRRRSGRASSQPQPGSRVKSAPNLLN